MGHHHQNQRYNSYMHAKCTKKTRQTNKQKNPRKNRNSSPSECIQCICTHPSHNCTLSSSLCIYFLTGRKPIARFSANVAFFLFILGSTVHWLLVIGKRLPSNSKGVKTASPSFSSFHLSFLQVFHFTAVLSNSPLTSAHPSLQSFNKLQLRPKNTSCLPPTSSPLSSPMVALAI